MNKSKSYGYYSHVKFEDQDGSLHSRLKALAAIDQVPLYKLVAVALEHYLSFRRHDAH